MATQPVNPLAAIAAGLPDVISLARGDPDLPSPPHVIDAAISALNAGRTGYSAPSGLPALRQALARKLAEDQGLERDPEREILITAGAQEATFLAINALLDPGDEILVPDPCYMSYRHAVTASGGRLVPIPTRPEDGWVPQPDDVAPLVTPRTKALALISPGNPTGAVYSPETLAALGALAEQHDLALISDEIYEKLVFDGARHVSVASLPGLADRTIVVGGFSKSYCMTGWRVGYLAVPPPLAAALETFHHTLTICAPTFAQEAALAALGGPQRYLTELVAEYDRRRRLAIPAFDALGLVCPPAPGSFYLFPDIRPTGLSSADFALRLLQEQRVLVHPGTLFGPGGEGFLRVALLQPLDRLAEALDRITRFIRG
jgi:aminotransferase